MREIAFISGRSTIGKDSILSSLAILAQPVVIADCSLSYNGLRQILAPTKGTERKLPFFRGFTFDEERCSHCRQCLNVCHQHAIGFNNDKIQYFEYRCSHCGSCIRWCPLMVLDLESQSDVSLHVSETRAGRFVYTDSLLEPSLYAGMIRAIREQGRQLTTNREEGIMLINGSRGLHDASEEALTGADTVLIIVSPSAWAAEDLDTDIKLSRHAGREPHLVLNMCGMDPGFDAFIEDHCASRQLHVAGRIPADRQFRQALEMRKSLVEYRPDSEAASALRQLWQYITEELSLER